MSEISEAYKQEAQLYGWDNDFVKRYFPVRGEFEPGLVVKEGKTREIQKPSRETSKVQLGFLEYLKSLDISYPWATCGSVPDRGMFANAEPHVHNKSVYFYMLDLKDAYPNADVDKTIEALDEMVPEKCQGCMHDFVENFATIQDVPGFPQGSRTSPILFDIGLVKLDKTLENYCSTRGIIYTRYLDDFTFSCQDDMFTPETKRTIRRIIENYSGTELNENKTEHHSIDSPKKAVTVTGVSIYPDNKIGPSPKVKKKMNRLDRKIRKIISGETKPRPLNYNHEQRLNKKGIYFADKDLPEHGFTWANGTRNEGGYIEWALAAMDTVKGYQSYMSGFLGRGCELTSDTFLVNRKVLKTIKYLENYLVNAIEEYEDDLFVLGGSAVLPEEWNNFYHRIKNREMQYQQDKERRRVKERQKQQRDIGGVVSGLVIEDFDEQDYYEECYEDQ